MHDSTAHMQSTHSQDTPDPDTRDLRIHTWISDQYRFALTEATPVSSPRQSDSSAPAIRADSPLLGFPDDYPYPRDLPHGEVDSDPGHASPSPPYDPLLFPSPNYTRDLPGYLWQVLGSRDKPLPAPPVTSSTPTPPSSASSQHGHSRLSHAPSQSAISLPSLAPSLSRRPSHTPSFSSQPSQSTHQLSHFSSHPSLSRQSSLCHQQPTPLPQNSSPTRRSSRFPSISSTLVSDTSSSPTISPTPTVNRNAVYIPTSTPVDELGLSLGLDPLNLEPMLSTLSLGLGSGLAPPTPALSPTTTSFSSSSTSSFDQDLFYTPRFSAFYTGASGVPPNTPSSPDHPPTSPYTYRYPYPSSSSQVYLGAPPPPPTPTTPTAPTLGEPFSQTPQVRTRSRAASTSLNAAVPSLPTSRSRSGSAPIMSASAPISRVGSHVTFPSTSTSASTGTASTSSPTLSTPHTSPGACAAVRYALDHDVDCDEERVFYEEPLDIEGDGKALPLTPPLSVVDVPGDGERPSADLDFSASPSSFTGPSASRWSLTSSMDVPVSSFSKRNSRSEKRKSAAAAAIKRSLEKEKRKSAEKEKEKEREKEKEKRKSASAEKERRKSTVDSKAKGGLLDVKGKSDGDVKMGKRKRLVSFISRLSTAGGVGLGIGLGLGYPEEVPPTPSRSRADSYAVPPSRPLVKEVATEVPVPPVSSASVDTSRLTPSASDTSVPPTPTATDFSCTSFSSSVPPTPTTIATELDHDEVEEREDPEEEDDFFPTTSSLSTLSSSPTSPRTLKSSPSLGSLSVASKSRVSLVSGLAARIGLGHGHGEEWSGLGDKMGMGKSRGGNKRKLVISGVGAEDVRGYEAVKAWCESFGQVSHISRKPNGNLHIDFRKASVAETVCRVQAQVYIKGAGSVCLSWHTKKGL